MARGKKPINLEMKGLKNNRQRVWEVLRAERNGITCKLAAYRADVDVGAARSYIRALVKAGYIEQQSSGLFEEQTLRLIKDCGAEAPAITRTGEPSSAGLGTETMWRSLRILGEVSAEELAEQAAAVAGKASIGTALQYLKWLCRAGYVHEAVSAKGGRNGRRARYRLAPGMYTGPKPPMVQRGGQLFDPNLGKVVYVHQPAAQEAARA